jgi:seryl-tRNA(Sec) selenium transferase
MASGASVLLQSTDKALAARQGLFYGGQKELLSKDQQLRKI